MRLTKATKKRKTREERERKNKKSYQAGAYYFCGYKKNF